MFRFIVEPLASQGGHGVVLNISSQLADHVLRASYIHKVIAVGNPVLESCGGATDFSPLLDIPIQTFRRYSSKYNSSWYIQATQPFTRYSSL